MSEHAIIASGLAKRYRIGAAQARADTFAGALVDLIKQPWRNLRDLRRLTRFDDADDADMIWALRDVSFTVGHGEVIGVIGRNGAGKSTLLKILSRITFPTRGRAELHGRLASLLEVGTGFHPELTGRENVYLNGTILGMTKREVDRRLDDIVDFSEIGRFLDTPVKRYSSGMLIRLAFSVAAHLEPEILLVDEVLAVGDVAFQRKCLGRMSTVAREGRTVLFVSHNMASVQKLCEKGFLLEGGHLIASGPIQEVLDRYLHMVGSKLEISLTERTDRSGDGRLRLESFVASGPDDSAATLACGRAASFRIGYRAAEAAPKVHVSIGIYNPMGECVLYLANDLTGALFPRLPPAGTVTCRLPRLPLLPGTYTVNLYATINGLLADWITDAAEIDVAAGDFFGTGKLPPPGFGHVLADHDWHSEEAEG